MAIARRSSLLQWCIVGIFVPILFVTYKMTMIPMVVTEAEPEIQCLPADFRDMQFIVGVHRNASNVQYMCRRKVRLGNYEDGGWDICDDAHFRPPKPCIIYSFGMHMDDHQRSDKIYFHSIGISDKDEVIKANTDEWQLFTYNTIRQKLQHANLDGTEVEWEQYYRALTVLRNLYHLGYRIFWTHQNHYCAFVSACKMEQRSNCHEISFVKVTNPF
ncbi:hypothetical protein MAR_029956 [Mya arenaria]|uniref:Uncharacterized protein n=1 Tax=Mya arenaria TaxID=6604 RepID=A0ABY7DKZ6_MYAAR|nr:hypothetical protein MAR_029956 [Mya arenaria]